MQARLSGEPSVPPASSTGKPSCNSKRTAASRLDQAASANSSGWTSTNSVKSTRVVGQHRPGGFFVAGGAGQSELFHGRRLLHQPLVDRLVAEQRGQLVRRFCGQLPLIDRAAGLGWHRRVTLLTDARRRTAGMFGQRSLDEPQVSQHDRHEDVDRRAALDQSTALPGEVDRVLGRRRDVIDAASVDVGAAIEQQVDDFRRRGDVQRQSSVAAALMHPCGILVKQLPHSFKPSQMRRRVNVDFCSAGNQRVGQSRIDVVEHRVAASPPVALQVDVGAVLHQNVDDFDVIACGVDGARTEAEQRTVNVRPQDGILGQKLSRSGRVALAHCR